MLLQCISSGKETRIFAGLGTEYCWGFISTTLFTNIAYVIQICQSHGNKRPFVSTANGALVGTLMTMGDVNDIFPIPLYSHGNVTTTPFNFVGI